MDSFRGTQFFSSNYNVKPFCLSNEAGQSNTLFVGERVAVKIIKQRTSLTNELNALKLHHENVTKIKHVIEETESDNEQNHGIIVMEYVGQNNLQALIEKNDLSVTLIKR